MYILVIEDELNALVHKGIRIRRRSENTEKIGTVEYYEETCYLRSGTNYLIT